MAAEVRLMSLGVRGKSRVILRGAERKAQSRAQPPCCLSPTFASAVFSWLIPSHPSERAECYRGSRNGANTVGDQRGAAEMQLKGPGQAAPKGVGRENGHSCPLCRFPAYPQ